MLATLIAVSCLLQPAEQPARATLTAPQPTTAAQKAPVAQDFPHSWLGHWKGPATVGDDARKQTFSMELVVAPTDKPDRFTWTIIYDGAAGRQERPYTLIITDAAKGQYTIDENNGILINARMIGGTLYTHFAVQGTRITTRKRLEGAGTDSPRITVEMVTTRDDQPADSGGKDGIPKVQSWTAISIQSATLTRLPAQPQQPKPAPQSTN